MGLLDKIRPQPGFKDADPLVRRAAIRTQEDPALLAEMLRSDPDAGVRDAANEALFALVMRPEADATALQALAILSDPKQVLTAARSAPGEAVSRAALDRLEDAKALGSVARHGEHASVRLAALARLRDPAELHSVAQKSPHRDVAIPALERLSLSLEELNLIAQHARCPAAAHRARVILHERSGAAGAPARPETDRPAQIRLCETVEALARSADCEPLQDRLAAAKDAWTDLLPHVDDDLHERFTNACDAARARLRRNLSEREDRARREAAVRALHDQHLAPRLALCDMVETAQGAEAPRRLDDARWEWDRLPAVDAGEPRVRAEAEALQARFTAACIACEERHAAWDKEQADAGLRATRAREKAERIAQQAGNLARLTKLADRLERLLGSGAIDLKRAEPGLREVRAALEEMPALPSRRDHHSMLERLKALQSSLAPKVAELRDSASWKMWANANVQEELCARVEALREVADPVAASQALRDLQARWKTASVVSRDRSQPLWQRFQAGAAEVRARLAAHRAALEDAAATHRGRKEAICQQVEAMADSTEWSRTAEAIKALQAEWKTLGPATRGHEKALWERFRKACDRFFGRRDEDLAGRRQAAEKSVAAREALCAQAEALADSTDWKTAAPTFKRLQAEWKTVGPVRRGRSDTTWARFRSACDRFFERYKRRDQIELEALAAARAGLCEAIETLASSETTGEALIAQVQELRGRWQAGPSLPAETAAALVERFQSALGRIIERHPEIVRGTDLDVEANRTGLEELCLRVEKLAQPDDAGDEDLSPAARLALRWREAMATNTIGGKAADEARWKSRSEEMQRARQAWERIGYVPEEIRRVLARRFEEACRRLADQRPKSPPEPIRRAGAAARRR